MFSDIIRQFLQKPLVARLSVVDPDGYPHTVPVWYKLDGNDLVVIAVRETRKVAYIQTNPKGSITVGGDTNDGGGYLIKGDFVIEPDPDDEWVTALCYHYETPEKAAQDVADWAELDIIILRLKPQRVIKVA